MSFPGSPSGSPRPRSPLAEGSLLSAHALQSREKIRCFIHPTSRAAAQVLARYVAQRISESGCDASHPFVLGLSMDSGLGAVYEELVSLHKEGKLSFKNVAVFNVAEYHALTPYMRQLQSHQIFLDTYLLEHVDILPENVHKIGYPSTDDQTSIVCERYEAELEAAGGIDLLLLGVSSSGRLGYNEPGAPKDGRMALMELEHKTRVSAASDFFGVSHVPTHAISMGLGNILAAREIVVVAFSEGKAGIVAKTVEGGVSASNPASYLQGHPVVSFLVDEAAATGLARMECPWTLGQGGKGLCTFDDFMERKAVIWLSLKVGKPILRLTPEDYSANHLLQLLKERGSAYDINIRVFRHMSDTITGWPGGKSTGPTTGTNSTFPKRVIVFSPHPDDDVISMGGTFIRLVEQKHQVHVCYQTSGNIAVWDDEVSRYAHFVTEFCKIFGISEEALNQISGIEKTIEEFISKKEPGQVDCPESQKIKGLIRQTEARAAARFCGVPPERIHHLHLPFYETGKVKKKPLGPEDVRLVRELIEQVRPHQIYCAGDLSDPHGTHRVCLNAILAAVDELKEVEWFKECEIWLYRGAWQEWEPERIDMAVPMSPDETLKKRYAIFKHQSQKDPAPFPGSDSREFWQRSEARNRATAELYDKLGLPEYEAIEAFVMYNNKKINF
jgi:glucosamine-6-phosphate deaminase